MDWFQLQNVNNTAGKTSVTVFKGQMVVTDGDVTISKFSKIRTSKYKY